MKVKTMMGKAVQIKLKDGSNRFGRLVCVAEDTVIIEDSIGFETTYKLNEIEYIKDIQTEEMITDKDYVKPRGKIFGK